jgi:hypothetical protein
MVKKLFALASVTALTGLMVSVAVAGCSSTTTETSDPSDSGTGSEGSTKDAKPPVGDDEEPPPSTECKGTLPVDATKLPWKSPHAEKGSCSPADLDGLVKFLEANTGAKYADWKKAITNPACNACVFGKETDADWRPLLENAKGELTGLNVGGCIAIASANDKCGQAYQQWFDCRFEACGDCPTGDSAAFQKCLPLANKAACKDAFDNVSTVCTDAVVGDAETTCNNVKYVFEAPIKAQCIGLAEGGE